MMRACVIGAGWAGEIHASAYAQDSRTQLIAVCDPDINKASALASRYGCQFYKSFDELINYESVDIASLASSTQTHAELAKKLLNKNIPFLCEKPLTRDSKSAKELKMMADDLGIPVGVNYNRRYASGYLFARKRIKKANKICFASSILAQNVPLTHSEKSRAKLSEDFLVFDALSHQIDIMRYLVGEIQEITAMGRRAGAGCLWTDLNVSIRFTSGALGNCICSMNGPKYGQLPIERSEFATETERIIVNNITDSVQWFNYSGNEIKRYSSSIFEVDNYIESMHMSISAWIDAIENGMNPPITLKEGVRAVELCEKVNLALKITERN